jgi:predicted nucleotidyltransferase
MRSDLPDIARSIGADERTLRRAVERGSVRCGRPGPRRLELAPGERSYLKRHWPLLARLTDVLRTERGVRLAVLFGSVARGDAGRRSDIDILVQLDGSDLAQRARLRRRIGEAAGRPVQLLALEEAEESALLMADVVEDGRVLIDRDGIWPAWRAREQDLRAEATREAEAAETRARAVFAYYGRDTR